MYRKIFTIAIVVCFSIPFVLFALDDAHFIQDDDYFVSKEPYKQGWISVELAKMIQPAKPETKKRSSIHDSKPGRRVLDKIFLENKNCNCS